MKPQKSIISSTVLLHSSDSHQKNKLFSNFSAEEMDNSGKRESRNLPTIRCIVKLGGAAITCKNELEKINEENLGVVSLQLRQAMASVSENQKILGMDWSKRPGKSGICCDVDEFKDQMNSVDPANFVVVHGAGSFGHFQASKSGVHRGGLDKPIVKAGFVATRISVTTLNLEIVRALAGAGIPSIGMSPFSCGWLTSERNLASADLSMVAKAIESGFMPVLHGDAVLDKQLGCTILSGDVIIRHLADYLKPEYVVFLTDVLGVYDRPPSEPDAVLMREISVTDDGSWSVVKPALGNANKPGLQSACVVLFLCNRDEMLFNIFVLVRKLK
ncbi:Isopentenyl phosphate kinase [Linum perenne]